MIRRFFLSLMLLMTCLFASPLTAAASFNPFSSVCSGQASSSAVCTDSQKTGNPISGPDGILLKVTHIIAIVAGVAAVIIFIVGALQYITSNGDSNSINNAKNTILSAVIGLVVIIVAQALISFVVSRI